ncbi:MAG: DUF2652 domain-containing protein [Chloroflexota bacterium]
MSTKAPSAASGLLLLADIGGYTSFLRAVEEAHRKDAFAGGAVPPAYALVSSLLDGIVEAIVPPFTLSKLEGDAVFAWAEEAEDLPRGPALLACLAACHADFRHRLEGVSEVWTCRCDACARVDALELKFVLHAGAFVVQSIAGRTELVGPEVVMAHRLLKTGAAALFGHGAYALMTDAAARRFDVPTAGSLLLVETIEHYPPVDLHVFSLLDSAAA